MTAQAISPPGHAELEAARLLLARMGISPSDLLNTAPARPLAPTFAEYIPVVSAAVSDGTRRVYGSYWNRIVEHWGQRRLDGPTAADIERLAEYVRTHTVARRNARGGRPRARRPPAPHPDQCLILLGERGGRVRGPRVPPPLMTPLQHHARDRPPPPPGQLLPSRTAQPTPTRRYDHLWQRLGQHL